MGLVRGNFLENRQKIEIFYNLIMYRVAFVEPTFIQAPDELSRACDGIIDPGGAESNPWITAQDEIIKIAGLAGVDGAYGEISTEVVQPTGYPLADPRHFPDGIPNTARLHTDYPNDGKARPTALYSHRGSRPTEFAVASCVSFKRSWGRSLPRDGLRRVSVLSYGSDSRQPVLPINWFEIAIGALDGSDAECEALDMLGMEVHEGRTVAAPLGHVALGDARTLFHRTPKYGVSEAGKQRLLVAARPTFI